jgi:hypothetical protein
MRKMCGPVIRPYEAMLWIWIEEGPKAPPPPPKNEDISSFDKLKIRPGKLEASPNAGCLKENM